MKRDWEGAAKKDHFSDQSVGLEILSDSFIPSFKESEMAWLQLYPVYLRSPGPAALLSYPITLAYCSISFSTGCTVRGD